MGALPYHKRYHGDALTGFMALTLEERGAYQTLLDMIYDRGCALIDNERLLAGYMNCSIRKWRQLRDDLIAKGKIRINSDGQITNDRAEKEIENQSKTHRKLIEAGAKGGRNRAENEKIFNEINEADQALLEPALSDPQAIPEARSQKLEKKEREDGGRPPTNYAFFGQIIRLSPRHLEEWRRTFSSILDLDAELSVIDGWWQGQPEGKRDNWFHPTKSMLNKKHQGNLATQREAEEDPMAVWMP